MDRSWSSEENTRISGSRVFWRNRQNHFLTPAIEPDKLTACSFALMANDAKRKTPTLESHSMPTLETIRAWKDEDYRLSLSEDSLAQLAEHPSGRIEFIKEKETDVFNYTTAPETCHPTLVVRTDLDCCCL
jgi:mersacidin/lichenicidin family type 2 lantibiotic